MVGPKFRPVFMDEIGPTNYINKVQSFRVHCLFTGQFNTEDYGTFTGVI